MSKPLMIWFDCTSRFELPEMRQQAMEFFDISCTSRIDLAGQEISRLRPKALCFDFDYPDQCRLRTMQAIKRANMGLPVLMFTIEHSEQLAVWAFRAPVWNYLVKPVATAELQDNLRALTQILSAERRSGRPICLSEAVVPHVIPTSRPGDPQQELLPALSFIEQHFNTRFSADRIARLCGMSRFQFSRTFHTTLESRSRITFCDTGSRRRAGCSNAPRPRSPTSVARSASTTSRISHGCFAATPACCRRSTQARTQDAASMHPSVLLAKPLRQSPWEQGVDSTPAVEAAKS